MSGDMGNGGNRKKAGDRKPTRNTNYITYTDVNEYLINLDKQHKESNEYMKNYQRKKGRPKKCPDQPMKRTIGEFILTFD